MQIGDFRTKKELVLNILNFEKPKSPSNPIESKKRASSFFEFYRVETGFGFLSLFPLNRAHFSTKNEPNLEGTLEQREPLNLIQILEKFVSVLLGILYD